MIHLEIALYDLLIPIHDADLLILIILDLGWRFSDFFFFFGLRWDYFPVYKFTVSFQALVLNTVCMFMLPQGEMA